MWKFISTDPNNSPDIKLDNAIEVIITDPFIYAIADKKSGLVLYYGRVINRNQYD